MIDQAYRKINTLLNQDSYRDTREFHAKTNNLILTHKAHSKEPPHTYQTFTEEMEYSDIPISPFDSQRLFLPESSAGESSLCRKKSATDFTDTSSSFDDLSSLLSQAFGTIQNDTQNILRPYPSGGALYSVQVIVGIRANRFLLSPEYTTIQTGFYHYRPSLHALDFLNPLDEKEMPDLLLNGTQPSLQAFNFCLIYVSFLAKAMFKYDYRGYRLSLLEAGSMYQQASLCGSHLGMRDRVWSYFEDTRLCKVIGLNPVNYLPLIAQLFGHSHV